MVSWQHCRRRSCMFEPLLSLNPHFARTMATAAVSPASSSSLPVPVLVVVGATTMVLASRPLASPSATGEAVSPASSLPVLVVVGPTTMASPSATGVAAAAAATTMVLASRLLASPSATGAAAASRGTKRRKTLLRDPDATTGQIHATSVRFQGFLGHDFHLTSKDYTYLNIL